MTISQALTVYNDPRLAHLDTDASQQILNKLWERVLVTDTRLATVSLDDKEQIRQAFMSKTPRVLEGYQPQSALEYRLLNNAYPEGYFGEASAEVPGLNPQARKNALQEIYSFNAIDNMVGITGGFSRLLSGLMQKSYNVDKNAEIASVNPEVVKFAMLQNGDDGLTAKQTQQILNGVAIVNDMALSHMLYGSFEQGGGALTKGLYNSKMAQSLMASAKSANAVTRALGKGGIFLTESLAEGIGYVGEEAFISAANAIASDEGFKEAFEMDSIPVAFAKGVIISSVGNLLGNTINRLGGVLKTFSWDGYRPGEKFTKAPVQMVQGQFELNDDFIRAARAAGESEEVIQSWTRANTRANEFIQDVTKGIDADATTVHVFNLTNDANLVKNVDGTFKVDFFQGKDISPVTVKDFTELNEKLNIIKSASWEKRAVESSQFFGDIKISVAQQAQAKGIKLNKSTVADLFAKEGEVDAGLIRNYLDSVNRQDINLIPREDYFSLSRTKNKNDLYIPTTIKSLDESLTFAQRLLKSIGTVDYSSTMAFIRSLGRGLDYNVDNLAKLSKGVELQELVNGKVRVGEEEFSSINRAMAELQFRNHTEEEIVEALGARDIYSRVNPDSTISLKVGQDGNWKNFSSFVDAFEQDSIYRLPGQMEDGFKLASDLKVKRTLNIATGGKDSLTQRLAKWSGDRKKQFVENINGDKIYLNKVDEKFIIEYGSSGVKKTVDSLAEAKKEIQKGIKTIDRISEVAEQKGYRVAPTAYGYNLIGNGEEKQFVSLDSLTSYLGKQEDLFNLKEFIDLPETQVQQLLKFNLKQMDEYVQNVEKKLYKIRTGPPPRTSQVGEEIRAFTTQINDRLRNLGDTRATALQERMVNMHKVFEKQNAGFREQVNRIFDKVSPLQKDHIQDVLSRETGGEFWPEMFEKLGYSGDKLNQMLAITGEVREMYDLLGNAFGISPDTWIKQYSTRIREGDLSQLMANKDYSDIAKGYLDPQQRNIKELDFYARNLREVDFVTSKFGNAQTMLELYARAGYRELYLGEAIKDVKAYLNTKGVNDEVRRLLSENAEKAMGRVYNEERLKSALKKRIANQNIIERINNNRGRFKKLSPERKAALVQSYKTRDFEYTMSTLINSSVMSGKLRLPLRNVSQVYTTLGPIAGNEYVWKAMGDVWENGEVLYREGLEKNIIQVRDPKTVDHWMAWLSNSNRVGMNHFKNSDDYTRIVAMKTFGDRFDDAFESLQRQEIDFEKFMAYSKGDLLNENDKLLFIDLIKKGEINNAKTLMQQRGVKWTMFDYGLLNKPESQTSGLGKLMGQFSTYPLSYWQLIARNMSLTKGIAGKAAFLGRLALNTYGVYYLYNEILGIQGMPTNPVGTLTFTGGPMLGAMTGIYNAVSNQNMSPGRKVGQIANELTTFVPFYGIGKKSVQAVQAITEADYYNAFIYSIGGTPVED